jgi:hypothetical protein
MTTLGVHLGKPIVKGTYDLLQGHLPASSSVVLAAARLRALTPAAQGGANRSPASKASTAVPHQPVANSGSPGQISTPS